MEGLLLGYGTPRDIRDITASYVVPGHDFHPHVSFLLSYHAAEIKYCAKWTQQQGRCFSPDFIDVLISSSGGYLRLRVDGNKLLYARNKYKLKRVSRADRSTVEEIIYAIEGTIKNDGYEIVPRARVVSS